MKYIPPARLFNKLQEEHITTGKSMQTIITQILDSYYFDNSSSSHTKQIRSNNEPFEICDNTDRFGRKEDC